MCSAPLDDTGGSTGRLESKKEKVRVLTEHFILLKMGGKKVEIL